MNTQIYEEASTWLVDFRAGDVDAGARRQFAAWLRTSPEHLRAYLEITEIWQDAGDLSAAERAEIDALIARALATDNVIQLDPHSTTSVAKPRRRAARLAASLAAALFLAVAGLWAYTQRDSYSTAVGEQRSIVLPDGSTIQLNAQSRIRVRYTTETRGLELLAGQALFHVAKDKARPFIVRSGVTQVRAVGTQFDVYRKHMGTVVTVLEGKVLVTAAGAMPTGTAEPRQSPLAAGEQLIVKPQAALLPAKVDVKNAVAWTERRLVFNQSPLAEVVEEFNRYNTRPLRIEGVTQDDFRISGVYASTDPALLLLFLREQAGIRVRETDDAIVIEARR